jgi:hypothetical protein
MDTGNLTEPGYHGLFTLGKDEKRPEHDQDNNNYNCNNQGLDADFHVIHPPGR